MWMLMYGDLYEAYQEVRTMAETLHAENAAIKVHFRTLDLAVANGEAR